MKEGRRNLKWWLLTTAGVLLATSCATTGNIPVDLAQDDRIYISPANQDGVQDEVALPLTVAPLERTRLTSYSVSVVDDADNVVRAFEDTVPSGGLLRRNRGPSVQVPEIALWAGDDDRGEFVPDGEYRLRVTVSDNRGNTGQGPEQVIVVDNTPPFSDLSTPFPLFTPNGDGRLDSLTIFQRNSTWERSWQGEFVDGTGQVVWSAVWEGAAGDFAWDGSQEGGGTASEGEYNYQLSATDEAGNTAAFRIEGIGLEREARQVALAVSAAVFSPNGDGRTDVLTLTPELRTNANVASWTMTVVDRHGDPVRQFRGDGVPASTAFDGRSDSNDLLPDGTYRALLEVIYRGGQQPQTASPLFRIDTQAPRAAVTLDNPVFSPDGDGRKDTVTFLQNSSNETEWTGDIASADGRVVRRWIWRGTAAGFSWDGRDSAGARVPDGIYRYRLSATDEAQNVGTVERGGLRVDTRATPVALTATTQRFSPNGDGVQDTVALDVGLTIPDGIESWSLSARDTARQGSAVVVSGAGRIPARVQWDGRIDGRVAADSSYVLDVAVTYTKGNVATARSAAVAVDNTPPVVTAAVVPRPFSPDGDGEAETVTITLGVTDAGPIDSWRAAILDPAGNLFTEFSGRGAPTAPIVWNGRSRSGELVQAAEDYRVVATATDATWNTGRREETIPVDILVIRDGDRLRINITAIQFAPNTADYQSAVGAEQARRNRQTLDRLAEVLKKYPLYQINVEGHAVRVYWDVPSRAEIEQNVVLLPLSEERARVVMEALVQRGIEGSRMSTRGFGGSRPVVPHGDLVNRWKNRRVEFILDRQ